MGTLHRRGERYAAYDGSAGCKKYGGKRGGGKERRRENWGGISFLPFEKGAAVETGPRKRVEATPLPKNNPLVDGLILRSTIIRHFKPDIGEIRTVLFLGGEAFFSLGPPQLSATGVEEVSVGGRRKQSLSS